MGRLAIQEQILEDLDKLSPERQREVRDLVHAMAASVLDQPTDQLRFAIDDPLYPHPANASTEDQLCALESPQASLDHIRELLADGRVLEASRLADEAASLFPDHTEVLTAAKVLNGSQARVGAGGEEPNTDEEFEWLRHPPQSVRGKWVALLGREAVAVCDTLAELVESLEPMNLPRQPLVHRID